MFDKVKQLNELRKMRSQALELQKELEKITKSHQSGNIKVIVSGDGKLVYLEIDGVPRPDIVKAINEALKEIQKEAAKKMLDMGGGLSGLLGKM